MMKPSSNPKDVESGAQNAGAFANPAPLSLTEKQKQWSKEQCQILTKLRNEGRNFDYISEKIPEHTPASCRSKWYNRYKSRWYPQQLDQATPLTRSPWSTEEDALCSSLRIGGEDWRAISAKLPGRTASACQMHFSRHADLVLEMRRRGSKEDEEQDGGGDDEVNEEDEEDLGPEGTGRERSTDESVMDNDADAEGVEDEGEDWWKEYRLST